MDIYINGFVCALEEAVFQTSLLLTGIIGGIISSWGSFGNQGRISDKVATCRRPWSAADHHNALRFVQEKQVAKMATELLKSQATQMLMTRKEEARVCQRFVSRSVQITMTRPFSSRLANISCNLNRSCWCLLKLYLWYPLIDPSPWTISVLNHLAQTLRHWVATLLSSSAETLMLNTFRAWQSAKAQSDPDLTIAVYGQIVCF